MKKFLALSLTLLVNIMMFAQGTPPPVPSGPPLPLPVNMYIVYLAVFMVGMAVWMFRKNIQKVVK